MQNESLNENKQTMYFLGIDIGTSFIKVALINDKHQVISIVKEPETEIKVYSQKQLFCQQNPQDWWKYVCQATRKLYSQNQSIFKDKLLKGIGISYQMHGLVLVDQNHKVLRNAIIWSDGRTHQVGLRLKQLVQQHKLEENLLNYPGNFTISKLKWVRQNYPEIFKRIHKILLPGDYIALKLSNKCTISEIGLSEGILWDFKQNKLSQKMLQICGIQPKLIPQIVSSFSFQGQVSQSGQTQSMIPQSTPILYRSGDQPNNAYTLNVTQIGQIAASGGTSGTVLLVSDKKQSTQLSRINTFLHINHTKSSPRYAKLLCINSCGIIYSWLRSNFAPDKSYQELNSIAESCQSQGLMVIPFGNGLQRMLNHTKINASIRNINLNRHGLKHIIRAALQSIAFSFIYGINILRKSQHPQVEIKKIKCANDNIFNCKLIVDIIESVIGCEMEIVQGVTGAVGCAKGAMETWETLYGKKDKENQRIVEISKNEKNSQQTLNNQHSRKKRTRYNQLYQIWQQQLIKQLKESKSSQ